MAECIICEYEFSLSKNKIKLKNQYHSTDKEEYKHYMCEGCYIDRSESEYRMIEGEVLCNKGGCARNATVFSKYCEICNNNTIYDE